ncbi:MAG: hypothetical protein SOI23_00550 [Atopobiaceae bacterium]|jgi:hypothetical protein|nr:hypothetical protein [Atopobium sp.]
MQSIYKGSQSDKKFFGLRQKRKELAMNKTLDFLKKAGVFYLNGDQAKVRPFGFVTERNEHLTFSASYFSDGEAEFIEKSQPVTTETLS